MTTLLPYVSPYLWTVQLSWSSLNLNVCPCLAHIWWAAWWGFFGLGWSTSGTSVDSVGTCWTTEFLSSLSSVAYWAVLGRRDLSNLTRYYCRESATTSHSCLIGLQSFKNCLNHGAIATLENMDLITLNFLKVSCQSVSQAWSGFGFWLLALLIRFWLFVGTISIMSWLTCQKYLHSSVRACFSFVEATLAQFRYVVMLKSDYFPHSLQIHVLQEFYSSWE